jgi:DNA (cytosine-5)-methyltransferase 1
MDLGLDRAGMECRWQVEIDPFCRKVLAKHWKDVPKYDDVRTVGKHNLEPVDLIAGGFPCQDVSLAGKQAGLLEGNRSGLWFEFYRIICELRPRYALIENVTGLISNGLDRVICDLAKSGYDAEWQVISACAFGAPHTRERLFVVAHSKNQRYDGRRRNDGNESRAPLYSTFGAELQHIALCYGEVWVVAGQQHNKRFVAPDILRVADGIPNRVDRLRGLGNAVVPQVAEYIGRRILESAI